MREKLLFHSSTQWDPPLGLLTLENMLIMNMLNKYSYFFLGDNGARCETLIQPHLNRKFIPSSPKENAPFQTTSLLCGVKSGNTGDDTETQQRTMKLSFLPFSAFILSLLNWKTRILSVIRTTHQSGHNGHPGLHKHSLMHIYTYRESSYIHT